VTTRGGVRLHVTVYEERAASAGQPVRDVLLLHGWPNSGRAWRPLAETMLLSPSYRLIAADFRGFGESEKAAAGYTCAQFADDVADVAAALRLTRYAVAGHSMGGKVAQLFASRQPVELTGLALIAPVPLVAAPAPEEKKAAQRAAQGDDEKTRQLLAAMAARPLAAETLAVLVEDGLRAAPAAWNGWLDPMREEDFTAEAGKIAVPTLVVGGAKDPLRTEELLRRDVVDRIPGAEYAGVPHVGHLMHLEAPEALASLLVNFLDRLPAPAA
jgi:pimeloyl-ACP methyl ester carboxylesterase